MLNQETKQNLPMVVNDDGFADVDVNDRVVRGDILRCVDGHWSVKTGGELPEKLLAIATATVLQCWKAQKPIATIRKKTGKPLPDLDELNAKVPSSEWEKNREGQPRPPWVRQHLVYLLDPATANTFTFINSTVGAATQQGQALWRS